MTDFSDHTNDDLADVAGDLIREVHARAEALTDTVPNRRKKRLARLLHAAADALKRDCVDDEVIQPFSGGSDKGDGETGGG